MSAYLLTNRLARMATILFSLLTLWWLILHFSGVKENFHNYLFAAVYGLMALLGGIWAFNSAEAWGGSKSVIGRAIIFLSLGLLAQEIGQLVFSFYNIYLKVEVPYPSLADIGFFGNIPFYIYGGLLLLRASGGRLTLNSIKSQLQAVLIPFIMLGISYFLFLQNYEFDWSNKLKIFLDFGYPLGQALYVSVAILTYSLSKKNC